MIGALYFISTKGDVLIQRTYRDDIECAPRWTGQRPSRLARPAPAAQSPPPSPRLALTAHLCPCSPSLATAFRTHVVNSKDSDAASSAPVRQFGDASFLYLRHADVYLLAITRSNSNAMMIFQFLSKARGMGAGWARTLGAGWLWEGRRLGTAARGLAALPAAHPR